MFHGLSRRNFLALAGAAATMDSTSLSRRLLAVALPVDSQPPAAPGVIRGNVRFQVLSPALLRMEYEPAGHFIDVPSVSVLNRSWPASAFEVHDADGWVEIKTSRMAVKYQLDSGKFTAGNLAVSWTDENGAHAWKPGDVDDKNLGGVGEDVPDVYPGPLSRNGYFRLNDSGTAIWNAALQWPEPRPNREEAQDWYFFVYGRDYKACLQEMTRLLGPIPMVPRYVFGTWAGSKAGYSADEWRRMVHRFREEEIPLDVLVLDSASTAAVIWRGFSWDPEQFPDPKGFFAWMKARGVKVTINEHDGPMTRQSDQHFDQVRLAMGLPETTTEIPNILTDKKYAELYTDVLHKPALDMGLAFWWQDEVGTSDIPGLDPMLWLRRVDYEGAERNTGKRAFVFCRLAGAGGTPPVGSPKGTPAWGVHRYGLNGGDVTPSWSALERYVPYNVRSGNVLAPYVTNITAFEQAISLDHEFYQRCIQFGSFSPVFWWQGLMGMRMPWEYGEECQENVKQVLTLRYRLLPYTYTYSRLAHETGAPLVRGTWLEYPEQEQAYTFQHQYLFGQALLVAPITQPGGGKPVRKQIYLPEGEHWFDYFTGQIYAGGQVLSYECPLSRMPLFVKAGSILPMAPEMQSTDDYPIDYLSLDIYAGKPAAFRLYEDEDTSLDYRKGAYAWTPIRYAPTSAEGDHAITIGPTEGRYQGQPQARWYRVQLHGLFRPGRVLVQGRVISEKRQWGNIRAEGWVWSPLERVATIDVITPIASRAAVTVTVEQAGVFSDAAAVQAVWDYRERLRRVKLAEKLLWGVLVGAGDIKKQPHVMEETERVEQTLDDLIDRGAGLAAHPVDLKGMTAAILSAFITKPFDSTRTLPELDPDAAKETLAIEHVTFTPEEVRSMTAELLACDLDAGATDRIAPPYGVMGGALVHARFLYDTALIDPPQIVYELALPDDGPPGWVELSREMHPDSSVTITVIAPIPTPMGPHTLKLRGIATWGPHQVILERDVVWTTGPSKGAEGNHEDE